MLMLFLWLFLIEGCENSMEMQVFITNLGKYNEGEINGAWFSPPIDFEEVKERIGLNGEYEEYAIFDYELPFEIGEYTPISEVNRLCAMVEEIAGTPLYVSLSEVQNYWFNIIEELMENQDVMMEYLVSEKIAHFTRYFVK